MYHACIGWKKVTPVLGIPRGHIWRVELIGYGIMTLVLARIALGAKKQANLHF